jgi:hypothetical protein
MRERSNRRRTPVVESQPGVVTTTNCSARAIGETVAGIGALTRQALAVKLDITIINAVIRMLMAPNFAIPF